MEPRGVWEVRRVVVAIAKGIIDGLAILAIMAILGCDGQINLFGSPTQVQGLPAASPSPTASPSPSASPTVNPCGPVVGVNLSGDTSVLIGSVFKVHVTPVSPSGPLEGTLDYCNAGRFPTIEALSTNLRCVGACNGFGPQFLAQGVGPFSVTVRVEGASAVFAGTVTR